MSLEYSLEDVVSVFPDYREYGSEIAIRDCPNCGDSRYKFWVNPSKGVGYCYKCNYSPHLSVLLGAAKLSGIGTTLKPSSDEPEDLPPMVRFRDIDMDHPVFSFLNERGLTCYSLEDYGVQYCPKGKCKSRIIFPFFGPSGEYRGFQGRYISNNVPGWIPKWYTGKGTKKSRILWNFDKVRAIQDWCVLVEGIFDALSMRDWAVAMLGKQPSSTQRQLLEYFEHIFIMLDPDATEDAERIAVDLVEDAAFRVTVVPLERGDPDDHEFEELVEKVREHAPVWFDRPPLDVC